MSMIPDGMRKRLEIAKTIKAVKGGWPESFVEMGVETMRKCPQKHWEKLHEQFETMAPGLTVAVLLRIAEEVIEQASEEDSEAYKNVIELFLRYIKNNANDRLGRDRHSEMWVCRESMRQFQPWQSEQDVDEARQMAEMVEELKKVLNDTPEISGQITSVLQEADTHATQVLKEQIKELMKNPEEHVALGTTFNISLVKCC